MECWGNNYYGQLGYGTTASSTTAMYGPESVVGLPAGNITSISCGKEHTCALVDGHDQNQGRYANRTVWCWGRGDYGQLGDGTITNRNTAVKVKGLAGNITSMEAGYLATCAVTEQGSVKCWGRGDYGQRGDGSTTTTTQTSALSPVSVQGLEDVVVTQISMGYYNMAAATTTGDMYTWGQNWNCQLGDGTTTNRATAIKPSELGDGYFVTQVSVGWYNTCARTLDGGELGISTTITTATAIAAANANDQSTQQHITTNATDDTIRYQPPLLHQPPRTT